MPAWIPVCRCRHRVGCARIKKAISEHGAFQHAGARFRTRGVSERLSGVSGRLAFRNGFWRSGTTGVPERLLAFRDGFWAFWHGFRPCRNAGRSGMGGGVPETAARRSGMAKTRSGTRGVPERVLPFRNGSGCSEAAIGGPERGGRRPRTASERAGTASGVPAREVSIRSARCPSMGFGCPETASGRAGRRRWRAKMAGVRGRAGRGQAGLFPSSFIGRCPLTLQLVGRSPLQNVNTHTREQAARQRTDTSVEADEERRPHAHV